MKKLSLLLLLFFSSLSAVAQQGARDADAVLNRCGKPFKGDETIYTNEGSSRTLKYERGNLLFTRVGNEGWKFVSGSHRKQQNLNADQMAAFFPCLPLALADSASPAPLKKVTSVDRIEVSLKHSFKKVILYIFIGLALLGLVLFLMSRRESNQE